MSEADRQSWLKTVPHRADGLAAWLEAGRHFYDDINTMGIAIKDASRDAQFANLPRAEWLGCALVLLGEQEWNESLIGLGEIAMGDALRLQNKTGEGLRLLDQAAVRFDLMEDEVGWARTRIGWLGSVFILEDYPPVEPIVQKAMEIFERKEVLHYFVPLIQNYAYLCIVEGRLAHSIPLCERAKEIAEQITPRDAQFVPLLSILTLLIRAHTELGHYEAAQSYIEAGMERVEERNLKNNLEAELLSAVANFYLRTGQYTQSIYCVNEALTYITRPDVTLRLNSQAAQAYLYLNRLEESAALLLDLIQQYERESQQEFVLAQLLYLLAEGYRLSHRWGEALESAQRAIQLMEQRETPSRAWLHVMYRQYAVLLQQSGAILEAEAVVANALRLAEAVSEHTEQVHTYLLSSQIVASPQEAWRLLNRAHQLAQPIPWLRWRVNQTVAALTDNSTKRRQALVQAVDDLDLVQSSLAASFHADYVVEAQNLYKALVDDYLQSGDIGLAWQTVERAKGRALLNSLMSHQEVPAATDSLPVAELKRLQLRHYELTKQVADGRIDFGEAEAPLAQIEQQIAKLQERIEVAQWGRREPLGVPAPFIPHAPPDSDLLGYYFSDTALYLFFHDGCNYYHQKVAVDLAALQDRLMSLVNLMAAVARVPDVVVTRLLAQCHVQLQALYDVLIRPIARYRRHTRLAIVPYGFLHQLPFHLLRDADSYLLEESEIRVVPTARLLRLERESTTRTVQHAVVSHSWNGHLPNAESEGRIIAKTLAAHHHLHGEAATKERVLALLNSRGVLHLAAHGAHRPDRPELSHIQLEDGQLTLVDLFRYPVNKDLVTLSACETGQMVVRAGDDPVGLLRGFLAAGARSLLVALWQLEDTASQEFMVAYYYHLSQGVSRIAALRHVQKEWLAEKSGRWRHPFYWGAFQLIGDDGVISLE